MADLSFFEECSRTLDDNNDRRERIIKQSRDITILSKRMIFLLHRSTPQTLDKVLAEAREKEAELLSLLANLAPEMSGQNYHRHARSVSGGAEEFIEAATFLRYLATGQIPTFTEMGAVFREATGYPLQPTDYLAGIGDLTGELMRLCLNAAARGDVPTASSACDAVRNVERLFPLAETAAAGTPGGYGVKKKVDEMRNSARKCELACFALRLRGMEKVPGRIFGLDDDNENGLGDEDESRPASAPRPAGRGGGRGRGRGGRGRGGGGGVKRDREQDNEAALMEDVEQS